MEDEGGAAAKIKKPTKPKSITSSSCSRHRNENIRVHSKGYINKLA